jgi:hypothetical protein
MGRGAGRCVRQWPSHGRLQASGRAPHKPLMARAEHTHRQVQKLSVKADQDPGATPAHASKDRACRLPPQKSIAIIHS